MTQRPDVDGPIGLHGEVRADEGDPLPVDQHVRRRGGIRVDDRSALDQRPHRFLRRSSQKRHRSRATALAAARTVDALPMLIEISPPVPGVTASQLIPADAGVLGRMALDDRLTGRIWVDDPGAPRAVLVIETGDGTVYGGGRLSANDVRSALTGVGTASGDLIFGFAGLDDPTRVGSRRPILGRGSHRLPPPTSPRRRGRRGDTGSGGRWPRRSNRRSSSSRRPRYADTLHAFEGQTDAGRRSASATA